MDLQSIIYALSVLLLLAFIIYIIKQISFKIRLKGMLENITPKAEATEKEPDLPTLEIKASDDQVVDKLVKTGWKKEQIETLMTKLQKK